MALQEKHRTRLYAHLVDHIDEDTAEAVLAQFPSRDLDEPVTKEFVALTAAELRTEFQVVRTEIQVVRTDLRAEIADLRLEVTKALDAQTEKLLKRIQAYGVVVGTISAVVTIGAAVIA